VSISIGEFRCVEIAHSKMTMFGTKSRLNAWESFVVFLAKISRDF